MNRAGAICGDGNDAHLFQPITNYRTLEFDKPLSTRMVWNIVARWGDYCGIGKLSPHDLRRTAITRALDHGLSYRQMQMISGYKDPKTVMRYDHNRENLDLNAVNHRAMTRRPRTGTAQKRRRRESVAARWIRWRTRMPRGWIFNASNRIIMTGKLAVRFI